MEDEKEKKLFGPLPVPDAPFDMEGKLYKTEEYKTWVDENIDKVIANNLFVLTRIMQDYVNIIKEEREMVKSIRLKQAIDRQGRNLGIVGKN